MKHTKALSLLVALIMLFGSMVATTALAATTTAETTVTAQAEANAEEAPQKSTLRQQIPKLLIFGAIVGVLAVGYGFTNIRYNQEKMDDMTDESRRAVERIQAMKEKNEK